MYAYHLALFFQKLYAGSLPMRGKLCHDPFCYEDERYC